LHNGSLRRGTASKQVQINVALLLWMTMIVMKTRIINTASLVCVDQWLAFKKNIHKFE
jgi:hypothetical protein